MHARSVQEVEGQTVIYHLDWISSFLSLWAIYLLGKKLWWAWLLSLVNIGIFLYMNIHFKLWGLVPANIIATGIFIKNARDWYCDSRN